MKLQKTPAIIPDQLAFAMTLADAAASGRIPQSGVGDKGLTLDMGDGALSDIAFNDNPQNRAMFAIRDQFGEGWETVMMRAWALADLFPDERMAAFVGEEKNGSPPLHRAVYEIAAVMPLNPKALFNANTFFRRVSARVQEIDREEKQ